MNYLDKKLDVNCVLDAIKEGKRLHKEMPELGSEDYLIKIEVVEFIWKLIRELRTKESDSDMVLLDLIDSLGKTKNFFFFFEQIGRYSYYDGPYSLQILPTCFRIPSRVKCSNRSIFTVLCVSPVARFTQDV